MIDVTIKLAHQIKSIYDKFEFWTGSNSKLMRSDTVGNARAFAKLIFRKFGFLLMERQIVAVIAPQNWYLLKNIR